jgi:hypothetical protein
MIAAVTNLSGHLTGFHRTWLDPEGFHAVAQGKAPIETPRRPMGDLLGHAVRFGVAGDVMVAGEGIETVLSLRGILPTMPMAATLSPHISPPSCSPSCSAASTSRATTIRPVTARWRR